MFKDKSTPGQELPGRPSETQTQGKNGKGISGNCPPKEPRGARAFKSLQEQEHTASIRPNPRTIPLALQVRPAVRQPGKSPGLKDQGHAGQEVPRGQSSVGPEALHPPANLQDARVKYGEGGPHHPRTRRLAHKKVINAATPVLTPGRILPKKAPQPDHWEKHLRSTKPLRRPLTLAGKNPRLA